MWTLQTAWRGITDDMIVALQMIWMWHHRSGQTGFEGGVRGPLGVPGIYDGDPDINFTFQIC